MILGTVLRSSTVHYFEISGRYGGEIVFGWKKTFFDKCRHHSFKVERLLVRDHSKKIIKKLGFYFLSQINIEIMLKIIEKIYNKNYFLTNIIYPILIVD